MAVDLRQFLPMFLSEVDEHLARMERGFLSLEAAAGNDGITELFRSAHTLKGAAASMGYGRMSDLTHRMETVLDQIRNGQRTPTAEIVDRFLAGVDVLKSLRREIADAGEEMTDVSDLVAAFERSASSEHAAGRDARAQPGRVGKRKKPPAAASAATPLPADTAGPIALAPVKQTVRIDVQRLDDLVNLVGELMVDRMRLVQIVEQLRSGADVAATTSALEAASHHLGRVATDLQAQLMKARTLPIEQLFSRFPRLVRDLARRAGKRIDLTLEGQETELDRSVIEQIVDPLIHLVRNAVDHGVEAPDVRVARGKSATGTVRLRASQERNSILVAVEDDGDGVDADRVRRKAVAMGLITADQAAAMPDAEAVALIFAAGLSTAAEVSDVSGRGVGMDVVRANLHAVGGTIHVETEIGKGTRVLLRLPLTLAVLRALLVQCAGETFALPLSAIYETIEIPRGQIRSIAGEDATVLRGVLLPLVTLSSLLGVKGDANPDTPLCLVVGNGRQRAGLLVDRVVREQEVVIKPLGTFVGEVPGVSGATILGDGRIALILDVSALLRRASRRKELSNVG